MFFVIIAKFVFFWWKRPQENFFQKYKKWYVFFTLRKFLLRTTSQIIPATFVFDLYTKLKLYLSYLTGYQLFFDRKKQKKVMTESNSAIFETFQLCPDTFGHNFFLVLSIKKRLASRQVGRIELQFSI